MAAAGAGCGREGEPDVVKGKDLFVQKCGACHVLGRANATGIQGPNLDQAFGQARRDGLGGDTVEGVVLRQIANPRRSSTMPADLVKGKDARAVAAYVALAAGNGGKDRGELAQAGQPKVSKKPVRAAKGVLDIDADPNGALAFTAVMALAEAGEVSFEMDNAASVLHNIAVRGRGVKEEGPQVGQGGKSVAKAKLKPGKYTFYCSVPGHEDGGMKGDLTVD
jgi:plastocyanin